MNHLLLSSCGADGKIFFYDIVQGKEVKKIDVNQNSSSNTSNKQLISLDRYESLTHIDFCLDGCTVALGTNQGRILTYNLKDARQSKMQLQAPNQIPITGILFQRPKRQSQGPNQSMTSAASRVSKNSE